MTKINAVITGVQGYLPDYILTNDELSTMMDTSDEWIMSRIGIKTRHILKGEGLGTSDMGTEAVKGLLKKTNTKPEEIDLLICGTVTSDMPFPATANIICDKVGIKDILSFDINAACSGFLFSLETASRFIQSGKYKKVIVVGADKMSSIIDYTERTVAPIFGDGAGAVLLEPTTEDFGVIDSILASDGVGRNFLQQKAGGSARPASHETIDAREHFVTQEGKHVFKWAVSKMADVSVEMMERHNITPKDLAWLVPHQANMRIIDATANRMGIEREQVMINIEKYGNTTSGTLPLCLWDYESQLKKGDKLILSAFGGGFTWGAIYMKWGYDTK